MERRSVVADRDGRLDSVLSAALADLSRSRLAALIRRGHVRVDGAEIRRPAQRVLAGTAIQVELPRPTPPAVLAQDLPLSIVDQDAHVVVVD